MEKRKASEIDLAMKLANLEDKLEMFQQDTGVVSRSIINLLGDAIRANLRYRSPDSNDGESSPDQIPQESPEVRG